MGALLGDTGKSCADTCAADAHAHARDSLCCTPTAGRRLSGDEFVLAMHLANWAVKSRAPLPEALPVTMLPGWGKLNR